MLKILPKNITNFLNKIYLRIPQRNRIYITHFLFLIAGPLFNGLPEYDLWKSERRPVRTLNFKANNLILIDKLEKCKSVNGSIAIHIHLHYADLASEFHNYLKNMPYSFDLFISLTSTENIETVRKTFSRLELLSKLTVEQVNNRGRDMAPMFCVFGSELKNYSFIAHLHSKKSLYTKGATEGWREYLCRSLLGSKKRVQKIFTAMQEGDPPYGIVYPQNFKSLPYMANTWLANKAQGHAWCNRLGIKKFPIGYFDFPAGSMFWARVDALKPLFDAGIKIDDFAEESGQTDGTFAHCLERLLVLSSLNQGFLPAVIKNDHTNAWSAWGLNNYVTRTFDNIAKHFSCSTYKVIGFDIFDTLLSRPLLDPESTKALVAEHFPGKVGQLYKLNRPRAEAQIRSKAGRDVGLTEIYEQFAHLTNLPEKTIMQLRATEEKIEKKTLQPRSEILMLFRQAQTAGKPVVLISDMFLPRSVIEDILQQHGITGWSELFLSSEIGLRKDTGELYQYVLRHFGINSSEMLMVGDNERSDWQIPHDMGAGTIHILKPVELARGVPRMRNLIETYDTCENLNDTLTMGLVVQHNFSPMTYPNFDPDSLFQPTPFNIGYSIVGPLLASFSQWLVETSKQYKVKELFFLAREGELMKRAYDLWSEGLDNSPSSKYLVLSRRAVSVPAIKDFSDIVQIARTPYVEGSIKDFLQIRYGVELDAQTWQQLDEKLGWPKERNVQILQQKIDHILPLLKELEPIISKISNDEFEGLYGYINSLELGNDYNQAVVDIGYSGTVQSFLNKIIKIPVSGFYMMTSNRAKYVSEENNVVIRGCFYELLEIENNAKDLPKLYNMSFDLEKLLSSNAPQIIRYDIDKQKNIFPKYQNLTDSELFSSKVREEIQNGTMKFIFDANNLRKNIYTNYKPSCKVATQLFDELNVNKSTNEKQIIKNIHLDDYYCGRDVI